MSHGAANAIYIGLMSGTSLDGVDVAVVDFSETPIQLIYADTTPYPDALRQDLQRLCREQTTTLDGLFRLDAMLGDLYASVANSALDSAGLKPDAIRAIGCHGQTIRHSPDTHPAYTVQIGDASRIATGTGIDTVADFRRKDIALGGQAAPLAPGFHQFLFRSSDEDRAVINIGGIANITFLPADPAKPVLGFDTGPGNTFLDAWAQQHLETTFDSAGNWAASGAVDRDLLQRMLDGEPYFHQASPKSTGTEYFSADWLKQFTDTSLEAADFQATLAELTASTIADGIRGLPALPRGCYICGGGAHNANLLERLARALPDCRIDTTAALGLNPDFVEACAFAWLACQRINALPGNLPEVTRARQSSILGALYLADGSLKS